MPGNLHSLLRRTALCFVLIFSVTLFSGCSFLLSLFMPQFVRSSVKFSEMTYERPDFNTLASDIEKTTALVKEDKVSYRRQLSALRDLNEIHWEYYSMYALAQLKYSLDTSDSFFQEECIFFSETEPQLQQKLNDLFNACCLSKHRSRFEDDYFGADGLSEYAEGDSYSDRLVELWQQEAQLLLTYKKTLNIGHFDYHGIDSDLNELLENAKDQQETVEIQNAYYRFLNPTVAELFAQLVKTRIEIAAELGYDSYEAYAYEILERDYTPDDTALFLSQVREKLVPVYRQAVANASYPDAPLLDSTELLTLFGKMAGRFDDTVLEAFDYMTECELYDIAPSAVKANETFTTYLPQYEAPFIMMNPTGTANDLMTFTHEFGHFTDKYISYNTNTQLDQNECASQGLEYLMLLYLDDCDESFRDYLTDSEMKDALMVYVSQCCYTDFEAQVYALAPDEITAAKINEIAGSCAVTYGMTGASGSFGDLWIQIPHFFEQAFYCISYCFTNDIALQLYKAESAEQGAGVRQYMEMLDWDLEKDFFENMERVGLQKPCTAERVSEIAQLLADVLNLSAVEAA